MFPFGIQPDAVSAMAPDTVNRLLLHGARYHDRPSVFRVRIAGRDEASENPDWRLDRHTIRVALALREARAVGEGGLVGIELPFGLELLILERAVWSLGAVSSFLPSRSPAVVCDVPAVRALLDRGAVLDTPERASKLRETAREVSPASLASVESDGEERSQAAWVSDIEAFLIADPPRRGARRVLAPDAPLLQRRVAAYAGWADGFTETILGLE